MNTWHEKYLKYQRAYALKRRKYARTKKVCRRCGDPALVFQVVNLGKVIETRFSLYCLKHRVKAKHGEVKP